MNRLTQSLTAVIFWKVTAIAVVAAVAFGPIGVLACTVFSPLLLRQTGLSGVVRLSENSFGLVVFPCARHLAISHVELVMVDWDTDTETVVLVEAFDPPRDPADLMVSTAGESSPRAATRQVLEPELLRRFNEDSTFLTRTWPPDDQFFVIRAFDETRQNDVAGGSNLQRRFDAPIGMALVDGVIADISDFRCGVLPFRRAWDLD